jgi:hypothetical protein
MAQCFVMVIFLSIEANAQGGDWVLDARPIATVGGANDGGPNTLSGIGQVVRLSDGAIVLSNGRKELRFYDASGKFVRAFGRSGAGPGEFEHIALLGALPGDTIYVFDARQKRLTFVDRTGHLIRVSPVTGSAYPGVVGILKDGTSILGPFLGDAPATSGTPILRRNAAYIRASKDGRRDTILTTTTSGIYLFSVGTDGGMGNLDVPFDAQPQVVSSTDRIYATNAEDYSIEVFDERGDSVFQISRTVSRTPISSGDWKAYELATLNSFGRGPYRGFFQQHYPKLPKRRFFPAIGKILVDRADNLWVQDYPVPGHVQVWRTFDQKGNPSRTITIPSDAEVMFVDGDFVAVRRLDSDDVQRIEVVRVVKRR